MKKILALLLSLLMLLSMFGCTEAEESKEDPAALTAAQTEPEETEPEETEPEETEPEETEPQIEPSSPVLYKATDSEGHVVYMLGSIHVGIEDMYPLPEYVLDAYESADALAVECDVVAAASDMTLAIEMAKEMVLTDGSKISDYISPECYEKAVEILEEHKTYNELMDWYMPVMWYSLITNFATEAAGTDSNLGVDMYFLNDAHETGKTIYEIESAQFQNTMLCSMSMELQAFMLEDAVNTYNDPEMNAQLLDMCKAWAEGNADGLLEETSTEGMTEEELLLYEEFNTAMEGQRNINMTNYAIDALASGETVFIVVGAAHVLGEDGMAASLAAAGYTVEQVQ